MLTVPPPFSSISTNTILSEIDCHLIIAIGKSKMNMVADIERDNILTTFPPFSSVSTTTTSSEIYCQLTILGNKPMVADIEGMTFSLHPRPSPPSLSTPVRVRSTAS
jgi:hypothetical protein